MGLRTLLLLLALGIGLWLFNNWRHRRIRGSDRQTRHNEPRMVRCARCGLHVPENEAVSGDDLHYCCEEHRRLGPSGQ